MEGLFKNKYRISSTRLCGWDYSSCGYYFVTICTNNRIEYFGEILKCNNGEYSMALSTIGKNVRDCWLAIPEHFPDVKLDAWIIMPNHVHGIIKIDKKQNHCNNPVETQNFAPLQARQTQSMSKFTPNRFGPQSRNLASIIRGFKIGVTKYAINNNIDFRWQSGYYDRIIRQENALYSVRHYIQTNPQYWNRDRNNFKGILY